MTRSITQLIGLVLVLAVSTAALGAEARRQLYSGTAAAIAKGGKAATDGDTDSPMYLDPYLPRYPTIKVFHPRLKGLWVAALVRPEVEMRRRAIETIGLAHERGMPGLTDVAGQLTKQLDEPTQHTIIRKAVAKALGRLDARQSAGSILDRNQADGVETILMTDPLLARWRHEPAYELWMARLADVNEPRIVRVSALQSLRQVRHAPAAEVLEHIATNKNADPALRLEAARALGDLVRQGLESIAQVQSSGQLIDKLVGVSLLRHHQGTAAQSLLLRFAVDDEPTIAAVALARLLEINPLLIKPIGDGLLSSGDHNVRRLAAMGVFAQKTPHAIEVLTPLLNDINPELRGYVRRQLIAQDKLAHLRPTIRAAASKVLEHDNWRELDEEALNDRVRSERRGLEQAAMVLGAADHEPAADELLDLLEYPRWEVRQQSAAALRRLEVPATLKPMLDYAGRVTAWALDPDGYPANDPYVATGIDGPRTLDVQVAQLMQAFVAMDYRDAEPLMRRHIPKPAINVPGPAKEARAAAIYALGYFYADTGDEQLAATLAGRLSDLSIMNPERPPVRRLSAITIGRIKGVSALRTLRSFNKAEKLNHEIGGACRWAIMHITGEDVPLPDPTLRPQVGWFLESTEKFEHHEYLPAR